MSERTIEEPVREIADAEFIEAVHELHPADTLTGGVKASQIAAYLDLSTRRARTRLKRLHEQGHIKRLGGLRGPTYAPITENQAT